MDGASKTRRHDAQVNRNTKDHTLFTYRIVTDRTCQKGVLQPSKHVRTPTVLRAPTFTLQCCGRHQLPYQTNTVRPPHTCLWASAVLRAPAFTIPGEHGKSPYVPLGINSMTGTDVCHTRRRRRNLPHASDINSVRGTYNHLVPNGVGNKT